MKKEPVRILFVNSEITPYLPETELSKTGRHLPQGIQERGKEIRSFMPRYGCINERRNQLHEVIRLSGMNIVINDIDRPLVIKVSSIPSARMQVYFIDNDDYFHRKFIYADGEGNFFGDNDERAVFFARGVLETVKKLRWKPDLVHCQGWITHLIPIMLKKSYKDDPIFENVKSVVSLYNDSAGISFDKSMPGKIDMPGIGKKELEIFGECTGTDLAKAALKYSDGAIIADSNLDAALKSAVSESGLPCIEHSGNENDEYIDRYNEFYDKILGI